MNKIDLPTFVPVDFEHMPLDDLRAALTEAEQTYARMSDDLSKRIASSVDLVQHVKTEHPRTFDVELTVRPSDGKKGAETYKAEGITADQVSAHVRGLATQATKGELLLSASDQVGAAQVQLRALQTAQRQLADRWRRARSRLQGAVYSAERRANAMRTADGHRAVRDAFVNRREATNAVDIDAA